jgi:hypothetical protein
LEEKEKGEKKEERIISLVLTTDVFGGKLSFILSFPFLKIANLKFNSQ